MTERRTTPATPPSRGWRKLHALNQVDATGAVLIVRLDDPDQAADVAERAIDGGFRVLEITLTTPGALAVIERLATRYAADGVVVGAGTVLDAPQARSALDAGAALLVSPHLDPELLRYANRHQVATVSGAYTPTEVLDSATAGADIVKLFPAEMHGPVWARSVLAPLAHIPLMPSGGVNAATIADWFDAGAACVAAGGAVTKADDVTAAAAEFLAAVRAARP